MGDHFVVCALTEVFCEGERLLILIQVQTIAPDDITS